MDKLVLLIDKDRELLTILKLALEREGFTVITARDGQGGIRMAYQNHPQAIILDVMIDKMDGWRTCQRLRQICDTPILILTATAREKDIIKGLSLGADDYLTKPCNFGELSARIRALIRRSSHDRDSEQRIYDDGHLRVDLGSGSVTRRGKTVHLTPIESGLFMYLVSQRGRIVPHRELLVQVWGPEYEREIGYLGVYIRYLRRKLEEDPARPRYVRTRYSMGYYFAGKKPSSRSGSPNLARMPAYDRAAVPGP